MAKKQLSLLPLAQLDAKNVKPPNPKESEVEAYAFIRHQLRDLG